MSIVVGRKYYKYTYSAWTQPVLTADGTLGGDSFAVAVEATINNQPAYYAFDGNSDTAARTGNSQPSWIIMYNPQPLKVTKIHYAQTEDNFWATDLEIQASTTGEDNTWVTLKSLTGLARYGDYTWDINTSNIYYKYYRIYITKASRTDTFYSPRPVNINTIELTATQRTGVVESTANDYDYYRDIKIRDGKRHGVYYGSTPIKAIYYGSDLIYQSDSLIASQSGDNTEYTVTLDKGVYEIVVTGGGGFGKFGAYNYAFYGQGGSGSSIYGEIYVPEDTTITYYAGEDYSPEGSSHYGYSSYIAVGGTQILTAGGGQCGWDFGNNGAGGTATNNLSASKIENLSLTFANGVAGGSGGTSVDPDGTSGEGGRATGTSSDRGNVGRVYIKYLRYQK